jgi:choline-sulfatase
VNTKGLGIAAFVAAIALASCGGRAPSRDLRPIARQNVLLITIDTLRADALACYGGPAQTPTLDRLAASGVRFDFAHAHAVTTLPSHASILTGTYPFQHGIRDNSGYRLAPASRTVATVLKQAGYATGAFVAAFPLHARFGLSQGFDTYDDRFGDTVAPDEFAMPERPAPAVVALARSWIGQQAASGAAQPWFAWVHLFDPHAPYRPPAPFDAQYAAQPYYGEVAAVDAALAPLVDDLRSSSRPTLVVVTGDHGEALGDHGEQTHGLFAYESTLRIPLIIAEVAPSRAGAPADDGRGDVSPVSARHVDLLPTILEGTGQAVPADLPGRSLLTGAARGDRTARPSYFEAMSAMLNRGWAPLSGVLVDRDKYVDVPIAERYDLARDSAEQTNIAGRMPERDRALVAALRGFNVAPAADRQAESAEVAARLQALGYLSGRAARKANYTDADDPKTLVDLDRDVHDAVEAFTSGRYADAVQIYQRVLARRPDMAIAYRHLAFIEWQRGRAPAAIEALQRAMNAGVRDPRLVGQLGSYLTETGRAAEGIALLESVATSADAGLDALNALGIAYAQTGRAAQARAVFERVLTIDPQSSVPLENLGLLALERGDVATARHQFERAAAANPRSARAQAGLGNVALRSGDREAAVNAWIRAVQFDPKNVDALYNIGTTLARDGKMAAARPYLEQFLRTAPPALYARDIQEVSRLLTRR